MLVAATAHGTGAQPSAPRGILVGEADDGSWFAAWDGSSRHVAPEIRSSKFSAWLAPFRSREEAERALAAIGATVETGR